MAGEDPVAAWLARRQPPSPSPETDAGLAGTIFADPVRDFLIRRGLHPTRSRSAQTIDDTVDALFTAPKRLTDYARANATFLEPGRGDADGIRDPITGNPLRAEAKGFVSGAGEAGAEMASPFNVATTVLPELRAPKAVQSLLRMASAGGNAFLSGMSAHQTADAVGRGDTRDALLDAGMTAMGVAGMAHGVRDLAAPAPRAPEPREVFENGNHRLPPLGPDFYDPRTIFEPHPGFTDRDPRPWWEPAPEPEVTVGDVPRVRVEPIAPRGLPSADTGLPGLPAHGGGPFAPEAPQGGIAAVPPYGPDVAWQHPKGAPPPIDIDAWLDGRQAAAAATGPTPPTAAAGAPSAPPAAQPRLVDGIDLDAERARLVKAHFPPELIDAALTRLLSGESEPPGMGRATGAPIPPALARVPPPPPAPRPHLEVPADPVPVTPPATAAAPAESPVSSRPAPSEGDALWQATLADARQQGYQGTAADLRAQFDQHVQSAHGLIGDMQDIAGDYAPSALMTEIRRLGGLRPFDREMGSGRHLRGDLASIVESFASPTTHGHRGASSIFRTNGLGLDDLVQQLQQDPRWRGLDDKQILEELDRSARRLNEDGYEIPSLDQAMHISGMRHGEPWWDARATDLLDTGEAQPRLPGDVGAVRDAEVPTPREEAPFALDRQIAGRAAPQQGDALGDLLNPRDPAQAKLATLTPSAHTPGYAAVPFPVIDAATEHGLPSRVDYSRPTLERVPLNDLVATQPTVTTAAVQEKLQAGRPADLDQLPVGVHGAPPRGDDAPVVFRDADGTLYLAGGTHRAVAAWARGDTDMQAIVYPTKSGRTVGELPAPQAPTANQPVQPTVRPNIKDFLVKQLRYTPEEVDALGPEKAMEIGNRVRMHPDGIQAGIAEHAKPAPPPYRATDPGPNLGEDSLRVSADELATLLGIQDRRTAMQRTRVPASDANVGRGTLEPTGLKPRTAAERQAAGEALTVKERQLLGLPEQTPERAAPVTQSEAALAKSRMTADARTRAKLLDTPTPENLDAYVRLMGEAADRQAEREFKGGTAKEDTLRTHERSGEYLASGLGGLQKLYDTNPALFWTVMRTAGGALVGALTDKDDPLAGMLAGGLAGAAAAPLWRVLRAKAPGVALALRDTLPPALGGKEGAPVGSQPVRAPRDLSKDIGGLEQRVYGQPHRTVPDVWKEISPVLDDMQAAERDQPSTTPALFQFTRNLYLHEVLTTIDGAAKAAREGQLPRRARYLEAMADELRGMPTVLERVVSDATSGRVSPKQTRATLHRVESAVYLNLLGAALDTALTNRTQILLAYPQIGGEALLAGVRRARTPEGQAETRFLETDRPTDAPALARVPNRTLRKLADLVLSPLKASDTRNRKDVYLGAVFAARKQGLSPAQAHEWAMEVTAQTQGTPGELGNNPFHRHLGPLRMFTKYPQIWGQWLADAATHPDPGVRRRLVGYFLGFAAVGAITGISVTNLLFPRIVPSAAAYKAGKDVLGHVLGSADHTLGEDLDPRRGGKAGIGRYPAKVATELGHFARYGFGAHVDQKPDGTPRGDHSAYEGFLSLLGQETNRQAGDRAALDDAYTWIADRTRHHAIGSRLSRQDLARAIEGGDTAGAADASKGLSHDQLRNFYRARQQSRYQQLLTRVPKAERAEFERRFRSRLLPGE